MKTKSPVVFAAILVFSLTFAGCNPGTNTNPPEEQVYSYTSGAGDVTYLLSIIQGPARAAYYSPASGDRYVLTVKYADGTSVTSNGTVTKVTNEAGNLVFDLSGGTNLKATISTEGEMKNIAGTITPDAGGAAAAPIEAPGAVTPRESGPVPTTGGILTVTDIPSRYNGKYAVVFGRGSNVEVLGAQDVSNAPQTVTLVQISNGQVKLPIWLTDGQGNPVGRYYGNDTFPFSETGGGVIFSILETSKLNDFVSPGLAFPSVSFSNGSAAVSFNDAFPFEAWRVPDGGDGDPNPGNQPIGTIMGLSYSHIIPVTDYLGGEAITYALIHTYSEARAILSAILGAPQEEGVLGVEGSGDDLPSDVFRLWGTGNIALFQDCVSLKQYRLCYWDDKTGYSTGVLWEK